MEPQPIKSILKKFPLPSTMLAEYDAVVLTAEESAEALMAAKAQKYWKLKEEEDHKAKVKAYQEATRPWSSEETEYHCGTMLHLNAKASGYEYVIDEHIKPVFTLLAQYFSNDPAFESDGRKLSKGILLLGDVGVGKTDLLKAFSKNRRQCFVPVSCIEIEEKCRKNGLEYWKTYTGKVPGHGNTADYFFQPTIGWMFDDMGTEDVINDYGNTLDALAKIIHQRYMQKDAVPFSALHMTTNMSGEMIEKRYDYRMRSRIREMFNVIKLNGNDRRS